MQHSRQGIRLFYSYAHEDEKLLDALRDNLAQLRRRGVIVDWHDRQIEAGEDWRRVIRKELDSADVILFLVSPPFLASDFAWGEEVLEAMEHHKHDRARVIPVILRPADWKKTPFGVLQALPKDARPITKWGNRDSAWLDVTSGIEKAAESFAAGQPSSPVQDLSTIVPDLKAPRSEPVRGERDKRPGGQVDRFVFDALKGPTLPGKLVRAEGDDASGDVTVDETYDAMGATLALFWDVYARKLSSSANSQLSAVVHYDKSWNNAVWSGTWLLIGDGDGQIFTRFSRCLDVIGHELSHIIIESDAGFTFWGESGALSESVADVFGSLIKQYSLNQTAVEADWLMGAGLLTEAVNGVALRSLSDPGTAYDDPILGKDPQPGHMRGFVVTDDDNGGVHVNSGIPSRAFYLLATLLGGHAWEKAGRIWLDAIGDSRLPSDARFADFAACTYDAALRRHGGESDEARAVKFAWDFVGVALTVSTG